MQRQRTTPEQRFWAKVDKDGPVPEHRPDLGPCWLWTASTTCRGYGYFFADGRNSRAHRFAYELLVGPIPEGLTIDHLCRNRGCVNAAHLEPVTSRENTQRARRLQSHCLHGHPLFGPNLYVRPNGVRECRVCVRARLAAWRQRRREARG